MRVRRCPHHPCEHGAPVATEADGRPPALVQQAVHMHELSIALHPEDYIAQAPAQQVVHPIAPLGRGREREGVARPDLAHGAAEDRGRHVVRLVDDNEPKPRQHMLRVVALGDGLHHAHDHVGVRLHAVSLDHPHRGAQEELAYARLPLLHEEPLVHKDQRAPAQLRREVEGEHRLAVPAGEHHDAPLGVGGGGEALLVGAHAALLHLGEGPDEPQRAWHAFVSRIDCGGAPAPVAAPKSIGAPTLGLVTPGAAPAGVATAGDDA